MLVPLQLPSYHSHSSVNIILFVPVLSLSLTMLVFCGVLGDRPLFLLHRFGVIVEIGVVLFVRCRG